MAEKNTGQALLEKLDSLEKGIEHLTKANYRDGATPGKVFAQAKADGRGDPRGGFKSFSHFCHDVRQAGVSKEYSSALKSWGDHVKAASGMNETVGSEGGFLVPPDFANELMKRTYDNPLLKMTTQRTCTGNSLTIPAIDETSRADGSRFGGVRCYWESEAAQFTATKPAYNLVELKLKKLIGLCHATDELLNDSGLAVEQHLFDVFGSEMGFKVGDALVNGTGAGQPVGVLNTPALVSVSKETGQGAATILFENINKMWSRCYAPSREKAVWLINQDVEPQLDGLAINVGTGGSPVYLPPGGLSETPYARLKGRPVIPVEFCATLGTVGDVLLVDLSQVLTLRKGEADQQTSIHFKFDTDETSFRVTFRVDAQPWWTAALTPYRGSATQSPFVALATRA
jgi:HK97 family phage major capsid protein